MNANYEMFWKQVREEAKSHGYNFSGYKEIKESMYKVTIVVRFRKKDEVYRTFKFVADYNRFGCTIDYCRAKFSEHPMHLVGTYIQTVEISKKDNVSFELMCTMVLNFICYLSEVQKCFKKLRNQSLGFFVDIDDDELLNTAVWSGTRKSLEIEFADLLYD